MNYEFKYCFSENKTNKSRINLAFDILFEQLERKPKHKDDKEVKQDK